MMVAICGRGGMMMMSWMCLRGAQVGGDQRSQKVEAEARYFSATVREHANMATLAWELAGATTL